MNAVARPWAGIPQLCPGNIIPFQSPSTTMNDSAPSTCPASFANEFSNAHADKISEYINRAKAAAWYLRLVYHAQSCMGCNVSSCRKTQTLLAHCETCASAHACSRSGCAQTMRLLQHSLECRGAGCVLCSLLADAEYSVPASLPTQPSTNQPPSISAARSSKRYIDCTPSIETKRSRNAA
jgi:hypothetical protein